MSKRPRRFVSHHSSKSQVALHVEKALAAHGVDCWIAPRDVDPGEAFDDAIMRAIASCDAVLLLFCKESDRSSHVKRELILADTRHKAIIPLRLEQIVPDKLAYHLANSQWIDWLEQRDNALRRIADKSRQLAAPVPPPPDEVRAEIATSLAPASPGVPASAVAATATPASSAARPAPQRIAVPPPQPRERQFIQPPPPAQGGNGLAIGLGVGGAVFALLLLIIVGIAYSDDTGANPSDEVLPSAVAAFEEPAPAPAASPSPTPQAATYSPSFDCSYARARAEQLICGDAALAALDREMSSGYRELLAISGALRGEIESDQTEWLRNERNACGDANCLTTAMRQRIYVIEVAKEMVRNGTAQQLNEEFGY